jgi:hypothetical protein
MACGASAAAALPVITAVLMCKAYSNTAWSRIFRHDVGDGAGNSWNRLTGRCIQREGVWSSSCLALTLNQPSHRPERVGGIRGLYLIQLLYKFCPCVWHQASGYVEDAIESVISIEVVRKLRRRGHVRRGCGHVRRGCGQASGLADDMHPPAHELVTLPVPATPAVSVPRALANQ